jgi:hypothetical protein
MRAKRAPNPPIYGQRNKDFEKVQRELQIGHVKRRLGYNVTNCDYECNYISTETPVTLPHTRRDKGS